MQRHNMIDDKVDRNTPALPTSVFVPQQYPFPDTLQFSPYNPLNSVTAALDFDGRYLALY